MMSILKKLTLTVATAGMLAVAPVSIGNTAKADDGDGWRSRDGRWRDGRWRGDSFRRWRGDRGYRRYYLPYYPPVYDSYYYRPYYGTADWYVPYYDFYRIPGVGRW